MIRPFSRRETEHAVLLASPPGAYVDGRWTQPDRVATAIRAATAPVSEGMARELLPEGARLEGMREFWVSGLAVALPTSTTSGDWLWYRGVTFRAISVRDWGAGFVAVIGTYIDPSAIAYRHRRPAVRSRLALGGDGTGKVIVRVTIRGVGVSMHTQARKLAAYIETLRLCQGRYADQPFRLLPWQRRFLAGAFGQPDDAAVSLARGGGKTTFAAAIATAALNGPLVEPMAESVIVAASFEQALIPFRHVLAFMRPAIEREPRRWRVQDSVNRASITDRETGAMLRVIGAKP